MLISAQSSLRYDATVAYSGANAERLLNKFILDLSFVSCLTSGELVPTPSS